MLLVMLELFSAVSEKFAFKNHITEEKTQTKNTKIRQNCYNKYKAQVYKVHYMSQFDNFIQLKLTVSKNCPLTSLQKFTFFVLRYI